MTRNASIGMIEHQIGCIGLLALKDVNPDRSGFNVLSLLHRLEDRDKKHRRLVDYHVPLVRQLKQHGVLAHDFELTALDPSIEQRHGNDPAFEGAVKRIWIPEVPRFLIVLLGYHCLTASLIFIHSAESLLLMPSGARLASLPIALSNFCIFLTFRRGIRLPRCHPVINNGF